MMELSNQDKQLLLDYCLGIAPKEQAPYIEGLIASNPQASQLVASFQGALSPLQTVRLESCPDELVEKTVARLKEAAGQEHLQQLLHAEQGRPATIRLDRWRNLAQIAAIAAMVLFTIGIVIPSFGFARNLTLRHRCQTQLSGIYDGLSSYVADHEGQLPSVATSDGSPWWKVGYQGTENHSNTRPIWLLVRQGYVDPGRFICPGATQKPEPRTLVVANYNDFPTKSHVRYSFRICCDKVRMDPRGRKVLMADMNPLSERLPTDYSQPFRLRLDPSLLNSNSINHRRSGQNILMCDGSVQFAKTRFVGVSQDDIFSTHSMTSGSELRGCETPSSEADAFVAP
jgi:hypothetical protein